MSIKSKFLKLLIEETRDDRLVWRYSDMLSLGGQPGFSSARRNQLYLIGWKDDGISLRVNPDVFDEEGKVEIGDDNKVSLLIDMLRLYSIVNEKATRDLPDIDDVLGSLLSDYEE